MDYEALEEAINAIGDEAEKLLQFDLPDEVEEGIERIIAIARYRFDIRTKEEKGGPSSGAVDD